MDDTIGAAHLGQADGLARFLSTHDVVVLDVVRGAAPDTHRLHLGKRPGDRVTHAVAISRGCDLPNPIDNEQAVLDYARCVLRPATRRSLPRVIERLDVGTQVSGLAMTAAPQWGSTGRRRDRSKDLMAAASQWLGEVWADTKAGSGPVDLGKSCVGTVLSQNPSTDQPAVDTVRRAWARLREIEVPLSLTHGCLCRRHVVATSAGIGVDDWGLGSVAGDPLRDLGRLAVSICDTRLPEVLVGRSSFAAGVRQFMTTVLSRMPAPAHLWREVLLLTQLELAFDAVDRGNPHEMARLSRAIHALQPPSRTR